MARASDKTQGFASARIAIDAMGGDSGPAAMLGGAARALKSDPSLRFLVIGDEAVLQAELAKHSYTLPTRSAVRRSRARRFAVPAPPRWGWRSPR